ncbi:MAG TPA: hypothetical protein VIY10_08540 [Solirubrobacteraceae bacterium]
MLDQGRRVDDAPLAADDVGELAERAEVGAVVGLAQHTGGQPPVARAL